MEKEDNFADLIQSLKKEYKYNVAYQEFLLAVEHVMLEIFDLKMSVIKSKTRKRLITDKRFMIFVKARQVFGKKIKLKEIGEPFFKDHATVSYAIRIHQSTLLRQKEYRLMYLLFSDKVDKIFSLSLEDMSTRKAILFLKELNAVGHLEREVMNSIIERLTDEALCSHLIDINNFCSMLDRLKNGQK